MKIFVIKNSVPIGTLVEDNEGNITFDYLENINVDKYLIGLEEKTNTSKKLFPVFENLLPEYEQLEGIRLKYDIKLEIDLLLHLDNIHGSFEFYSEDEFSNFIHKRNKIFRYSDAKVKILDNSYIFPNILNDYELNIPNEKLYPIGLTGSKLIGISGFQYKFGIHKDVSQKKISFDDKDSSDYIMKPYNSHYSKFTPDIKDSIYIPYLLINEHIFMTLARDFGFDVPYNAIIKGNDDYHYIIKRYDRYQGLKIDHHEVLTLINRLSSEKYDISCKEIAEAVSKYLNQDEMLKLFRFIVFSIVISHGDLHAKNISLIYKSNSLEERAMTLAPHYDISTVRIYKKVDQNDIGMEIQNKRKDITLKILLWFANICHINNDIAIKEINDIALRFINEFEKYIQLLPQDIKILPVYKNRYRAFDTLETVFNKFYKNRCMYINKYLLKYVPNIDDSLWD